MFTLLVVVKFAPPRFVCVPLTVTAPAKVAPVEDKTAALDVPPSTVKRMDRLAAVRKTMSPSKEDATRPDAVPDMPIIAESVPVL